MREPGGGWSLKRKPYLRDGNLGLGRMGERDMDVNIEKGSHIC